jgi:hypothetical protein
MRHLEGLAEHGMAGYWIVYRPGENPTGYRDYSRAEAEAQREFPDGRYVIERVPGTRDPRGFKRSFP